ncbi:MAG: SurA N-terminal domain-containing protein [Betaproteobacteria bacterium]
MFDAVRNNKKIVQIFLALITLPFAFWGVDSYVRNAANDGAVAKIGSIKITNQQFQQELRERQERFRSQMGPLFDPKMMDLPEVRRGILNEMIDQRVLMLEAQKNRIGASDEALRRAITSMQGFQENGKFSPERYETLIKAQGMTPAAFEAQLRQDLTLQQMAGTVGRANIVAKTVSDRVLGIQSAQREVLEYRFTAEAFLGQVKLEEGAAKKYYDANARQFEIPEQARAEFVVLSQEAIGSQVSVSDAEIKAWYEGHKDRYQQPEERRASHILVKLDDKDKDKAKVKAKAEELLKEVQKNPAAFAELAKKNSEDPGSAEKGGDLGFFGRGAMVKPFEDAAFKLKEGEISGLVESDFGFHIIKITAIRAAKEKTLAEVRPEIEAELKRSAASRKFAEAAEAFSNGVYEQADSLKPVADKFKLTIQQSGWLTRTPNPANGPLANEKILKSLFSEDAIKNKRNTEAVETGPNTLVAARIAEYKPSAQQPFETVRANIENLLKHQQAEALAKKAGEERLAALQKGADEKQIAWSAPKTISRLDAKAVPPAAVPAIFKADAAKLPAFAGAELPGAGYALYKIVKAEAGKIDDERRRVISGQLETLIAQEEMQAYIAALRARYKVEIDKTLLEAKEK